MKLLSCFLRTCLLVTWVFFVILIIKYDKVSENEFHDLFWNFFFRSRTQVAVLLYGCQKVMSLKSWYISCFETFSLIWLTTYFIYLYYENYYHLKQSIFFLATVTHRRTKEKSVIGSLGLFYELYFSGKRSTRKSIKCSLDHLCDC